MREWRDTKIALDKYIQINCYVLISKNTSYDILFGLNAFD